jgi:hypothetical protein
LRALATELGTSHQLLQHYLGGLEKWKAEEDCRRAKIRLEEIRARVKAEGRNDWEEWRANPEYRQATFRALVVPSTLKQIEEMKQEAKRGPLHRLQIKLLKMFTKWGFSEAQKVLDARPRVKQRKPFAEIVKETPRDEGETSSAWVHRIWNECDKYETNIPTVLTDELLEKYSQVEGGGPKRRPITEAYRRILENPAAEPITKADVLAKAMYEQAQLGNVEVRREITERLRKCSQGSAKNQKNNLPAISPREPKSFRTA